MWLSNEYSPKCTKQDEEKHPTFVEMVAKLRSRNNCRDGDNPAKQTHKTLTELNLSVRSLSKDGSPAKQIEKTLSSIDLCAHWADVAIMQSKSRRLLNSIDQYADWAEAAILQRKSRRRWAQCLNRSGCSLSRDGSPWANWCGSGPCAISENLGRVRRRWHFGVRDVLLRLAERQLGRTHVHSYHRGVMVGNLDSWFRTISEQQNRWIEFRLRLLVIRKNELTWDEGKSP